MRAVQIDVMEELEEQKEVINQLMEELSKKSIEVSDIKRKHDSEQAELMKQIDQAYAMVSEVKIQLATCKTEKIQLQDQLESLTGKTL